MTSSTMARAIRALATAVLGVGASLLFVLGPAASVAQAHTELVRVTPAADSTAKTAPRAVRLDFATSLMDELTEVRVRNALGTWEAGPAVTTGGTVVVPLRPLTAAGPYEIDYRVVAADGHPVIGKVPFTVSAAAASAARHQRVETSTSSTGSATDVAAQGAVTVPVSGGRWDSLTTGLGIGTVVALLLLALVRRGASVRSQQS